MEKITAGKFGTNTYVITSNDECLIVDPGYDINNHLNIISNYKVVGILLTHCHCDHIDSIGLFDCPIYIHELDSDGLNNQNSLYTLVGDTPSFDYKRLNVITFKNNEKLIINNFQIETIHTPGHTKGSSCFLHKNNLYTGDTLFKNTIGRTDLPTGDHRKILESIKELATCLDSKTNVYPGHGDKTTIKEEIKNNLYLKTL